MKFHLLILICLLFAASIAKADHLAIACGANKDAGFRQAEVSLSAEDGAGELFLRGVEQTRFKVSQVNDTMVASDADLIPRGADISHTEFLFAGDCAKQTVKAQKNEVGGFAGRLPGAVTDCTCDED